MIRGMVPVITNERDFDSLTQNADLYKKDFYTFKLKILKLNDIRHKIDNKSLNIKYIYLRKNKT